MYSFLQEFVLNRYLTTTVSSYPKNKIKIPELSDLKLYLSKNVKSK